MISGWVSQFLLERLCWLLTTSRWGATYDADGQDADGFDDMMTITTMIMAMMMLTNDQLQQGVARHILGEGFHLQHSSKVANSFAC